MSDSQPIRSKPIVGQPPLSAVSRRKVIIEGADVRFEMVQEASQRERWLYARHVSIGRLKLKNGVVFDDQSKPLPQTLYLLKKSNTATSLDAADSSGRKVSNSIVGYNAGWRNYYHFVAQTCFSVWLYKQFGEAGREIILPPLGERQRDVFRRTTGFRSASELKGQILDLDDVVILDTNYRPFDFKPSPLLKQFGRDVSLRHARAKHKTKRVYISRRDSRNRVMRNELELEKVLVAEGFSPLLLSDLSFTDQVAALAGAEVIVAPHGAGLTNIIFAPPGTKIIELCPSAYVNPCFAAIARVMGHDHTTIVCPSGGSAGRQQEVSWEVPIAVVMRVLHSAP